MTLLTNRDAYQDKAQVPSSLVHSLGTSAAAARATIAIPTYRRQDLLPEALASALAQRGSVSFEVIVIDNDPDTDIAAVGRMLAALPNPAGIPIRYFANADNIGMFGNWNRCIELARGEWVTVLNDDDLLRPEYLERMFSLIDRRPEIEGMVCRTERYYRRPAGAVSEPIAQGSALRRLARRWRYDRDGITRISPRTMFFGLELGSGLGFLFRRDVAMALGGYKPEEYPTADGMFYVRFSIGHGLFWTQEVLADIGVGENESMRPDVLSGAVRKLYDLRRELVAAGHVPARWMTIDPLLVANSIHDAKRLWDVPVDRQAFEQEFDMALPPPNYRKVTVFRMLNRGY